MVDTSQERLNKLIEGGAPATPIHVPTFYATAVSLSSESNSFSVLFSKGQPAVVLNGNEQLQAQLSQPQVVLELSPQTAKDLYLVIKDAVDRYEQIYAPIVTEFSRTRDKK